MAQELNVATVKFKGKDYSYILNPKHFSTGSTGFWTGGKLEVSPEERYQISIQLVLIGSKPKAQTT